MSSKHILIIEDQDLMRMALMDEVKAAFAHCIVIGVQTAELAFRELEHHAFDLVIVDPGLPGYDPSSPDERMGMVSRLVDASPTAIHLVVTGSDTTEEIDLCRATGAAAYLAKNGLKRGTLVDIIDRVSASGFFACPACSVMELPDFHYSDLTPREQEIVNLMASRRQGVKRKEVYEIMSERCGIDVGTAEKYFKQARAKILKRGHVPEGI